MNKSRVYQAGSMVLVMALMLLASAVGFAQGKVESYGAYMARHADKAAAQAAFELTLEPNGIALKEAGAFAEITFEAETEGIYELKLRYMALPERGNAIRMSIKLDGEAPFSEAENITLRRLYQDAEPIRQSSRGNDIRPKVAEIPAWQTLRLLDDRNHYANPYGFYLSKGTHTLTLTLEEEAVAIDQIQFVPKEVLPSYKAYLAQNADVQDTNASAMTQAEVSGYKSAAVIQPISDRSSAATTPNDPVKVRLNSIGGNSWKTQGEFIEWTLNVPEDGFYYLSMRVSQNELRGMNATRRIAIDGQVPFEDMAFSVFPYQSDWYYWTLLVNGQPAKVALTKGVHTLRMTVAANATSDSLRIMEDVVQQLNTLYRRVIMITGDNADAERVTIDANRDFHLEKKIPDLMDNMKSIAATLRQQHAAIEAVNGKGSEASALLIVASQLESFVKEPETIPARLEAYKGNVSSMATWVLKMRDQPLQIDRIDLTGAALAVKDNPVSLADQIKFRAEAFVGSFYEDYTAVGDIYENGAQSKPLTVWISASDLGGTGVASGRDQAQILKTLIDDLFVPRTGISVNLSLIAGSQTLMQATLGGKGPDVALMVYKDLPVNLAMRGALHDLSAFEGIGKATEEFYESALLPYRYQGGLYALPETQAFDMLFYRKDILDEMGLSVPTTWKEFFAMVQVLQKSSMQVGIPAPDMTNANTMGFQAQLFQRGVSFYADDLSATTFNQPLALEAFKAWTDMYSKYSLPIKYDAFSRFRTGEMPLIIESYTFANQLAAAAPELQGIWDFAPIPGMLKADGSVDCSQGARGTAGIILKDTTMPEQAFAFLQWWVSAEIQAQFGVELEGLVGSAARYPTANKMAFQKLPWSRKQAQALQAQWEYVKDIPQLPGNYITNRNLAFAFRKVVLQYANPRETLYQYNREINKEIERKWMEFGQ